jgi:putative NADH-flavin reductase
VAIARAEQLAAIARSPQSDSWVAGQQALSAAVAERYPVTRALADIDALATARVVGRGPLSQADQQALRQAAAAVEAINARQAARVAAVQRRLGG